MTATHVAWRFKTNAPPPVFVNGLLFMVSGQGNATDLDAKNREPLDKHLNK